MMSECKETPYPYLFSPNRDIRLIGITGKSGSGKSSVADYLVNNFLDLDKFAFATALKESCAKAFGLDIYSFYGSEEKETVHPLWGVTPREIAQFVGTELFRQKINEILPITLGPNFWVKRLFGYMQGSLPDDAGTYLNLDGTVCVIEDVRFQNEVEFIEKNNGHIISVIKEGDIHEVGIPGHESEKQQLVFSNDHLTVVHNDRTLEDLHSWCRDWGRKHGLVPLDPHYSHSSKY